MGECRNQHYIHGAWGVTCAANLTPDEANCLVSWKTAHFAKAMCTEQT